MPSFLIFAESLITKELSRCDECFDSQTRSKISDILTECVLGLHLSSLPTEKLTEFAQLVQFNQVEDLTRLVANLRKIDAELKSI